VKFAATVLAFACIPLAAQTSPATHGASASVALSPAATATSTASQFAPPQTIDTSVGFSYSLPADWEILASKPTKPDVPFPAVEGPKRGNACAQVELTARHGVPPSVVVIAALPFDCYGQVLTTKNLPEFAAGAAEGLKQTFEVADPVIGNYSLGSHKMWIERAKGTVKGQANSKYTLEIACTVLAKGAACWMAMAADAASLQTFEQQAVTLEGEMFDAIVPASAFQAPASAPSKPS
jgi:hypothetical protein